MKSKQTSIRPLGQRSISSTLLFRPLNRSNVCQKDEQVNAQIEKGSVFSRNDFVNKKLHRSSVLPGSLQGKSKPFLSPVAVGKATECTQENNSENHTQKVKNDASSALDAMLELFKHNKTKVKDNVTALSDDDGIVGTNDIHGSGKSKHGEVDKQISGKRLAVLGDDSGTPRRVKTKRSTTDMKPRPFFNHYANGSGWWDDNMEGIDNEEVGCNEVWEGMGSTTLGGLEWH